MACHFRLNGPKLKEKKLKGNNQTFIHSFKIESIRLRGISRGFFQQHLRLYHLLTNLEAQFTSYDKKKIDGNEL